MRILQNLPHLNQLGISRPNRIYWQLNTPQLYEEAVQRHEGYVAHLGPLVVRTGNQTSLTHCDRYIVAEPATQGNISWGEINRAYDEDRFDNLLKRMTAYFNGVDVFVQDAYVRKATTNKLLSMRVITETAWHNLFVRNNYVHPQPDEVDDFEPEFTIVHAPGFRAIPQRDFTNSDVFVIIHLTRKLVLIGGTSFAGEIRKTIFSVMNYLLPRQDVLTLESTANVGSNGASALFIGADGSGKTALATDDTRLLLGDGGHGWDGDGIFSMERGCYANIMGLNAKSSPDIWDTTRRFGTILENVVVDVQTRLVQLDDDSITDNTRASYPISHLVRATRDGSATHPRHVFLLTEDGSGVLPLVSKLTHEQAHYYFLSGYSTEIVTDKYGDTVAQAKFSSCYGAPFMPLHAGHYGQLFFDKIKQHNVNVWLLNTGWIGGDYANGKSVTLETSRHIVRAVLNEMLANVEFKRDTHFGLMIPTHCPGIVDVSLNPIENWADQSAYETAAQQLMSQFDQNFSQYENEVNPKFLAAQPRYS